MVFATLVIANIFLTLANRSFYDSVIESFKYKNNLLLGVIGITIVLLAGLVYVPILANFFKLTPLSLSQLGFVSLVSLGSVGWCEGFKWGKRKRFW